ncbi:hypothetical protein [Stigmatella hybrida]|uniref:hypothetical protein n=1 Tax=Stigmatella hybrida TaxID=394097 RepID=UPI001CDAC627|nr:hypothetical protein [Stigmatella hybrida]
MNSTKLEARKQLMFAAGEDFYFIAYSTLLTLKGFDCISESKTFKDHRKLAFLVDFLADPKLTWLLDNHPVGEPISSPIAQTDKDRLYSTHNRGLARIPLFFRVLATLERRSIIQTKKGDTPGLLDMHITDPKLVQTLWENPLFKVERQNFLVVKKRIPRLRTATLPLVLNRLFGDFGVTTWLA